MLSTSIISLKQCIEVLFRILEKERNYQNQTTFKLKKRCVCRYMIGQLYSQSSENERMLLDRACFESVTRNHFMNLMCVVFRPIKS